MWRFGGLFVLLALCVGVGGCGGHSDRSVTPLDDALGYFSKDAPFVAAITTDPGDPQVKQIKALAGRFPAADILGARLRALTRFRSSSWDRDVRPQLGAPLVVGLARPAAGSALSAALIAAIHVKHPLRAKQTLLREPGFQGSSESSGVRIYEDTADQRYVAVDGDTVVAATKREFLEQALALKRSDNRMRAPGFMRDLRGLPSDGLVSVSADPRAMLGADARMRPALNVKWIASLRRLGAVVKASDSGLTLDFHAASDPRAIGNADLPLAPKARAIPLIGKRSELQVGVAEPNRLARLAFAVTAAIAPKRLSMLRALEPTGVDLERQIPHHLAKLLQLGLDPLSRQFALRADLNQSADVRNALGQLAPALPAAAALFGMPGLGVATPTPGESFYALAKPSGGTAVFGVVGNSLVAASEARRAADLASEPTHSAPAARPAAAVLTVNARDLAGRLLAKQLSGASALLAPLAVGSLRDLTAFLTNDRKGLDGHVKLTIVK